MTATTLAVYVLAITVLLCPGGWLLERGFAALRWPVRWVWVGVVSLTLALPLMTLVGREERVPVSGSLVQERRPAGQGSSLPAISGEGDRSFSATAPSIAGLAERISRAVAAGGAILAREPWLNRWTVGLWATGSALMALFLTISILRLRRLIRGLSDAVVFGESVKVSPVRGPLTIGPFDPVVVLPAWAMDLQASDLHMIVRHEAEHVRSRDPQLLALGLLALTAFPWNPLVWWQVRGLRAAVEMDCDLRVLRSGANPAEYGKLLLRVGSQRPFSTLVSPALATSTTLLERRPHTMADMYRKISVISVLTFIAAATLLIGVACTVEPPISPGKENQLDTGEAAHLVAPSAPESDSVVSITVDQVGTVAVDGVAQPLTTLATTLAAVPENSIASLEAHKSAPYRVVSAVQDHLRQAGLLRVVFTEVESEELDAAPQDLASLLSRGLATVLPPAPAREVEISRRNLLELEVRPGGSVTAIRGRDESRQETTPEGVEAMVRSELQLNPNLVAVVRTYPDAEYRHMFAVVSALQRAKATRYSIQMVEERP